MSIIKFLKLFENHPYISVVLYQEKIIYINNTLKNLLGLTDKNITNLPTENLFPEGPIREKIKKIIKKRIHEYHPEASYESIPVNAQNNKRIYMNFFAQSIIYNGSYAGLVMAIDATKETKQEFLIKILKDINQTIVTKETVDEIFDEITKSILQKGDFEFVCASIKEEDSNEMDPKFCIGNYDDDFLTFLKTVFKADSAYSKVCMATQYMLNNKFMIVNDLEKINFPNKTLVNTLLERNFRSILFFPIFKNNRLYASIGICSKYKDDFDKNAIAIFEEAKQDIEFALNKIEKFSYLKLLQEALDKAYSWIVITDDNAKILYANKCVENISGYNIIELLGKNPNVFKSGYHSKGFYEKLWKQLNNNEVVETLLINKDKTGHLFYLRDRIIPVKTQEGKKYYISLAVDITKEENLKTKLKNIYTKDMATNLLNRNGFLQELEKLPKADYALLLIDIRDFKIFNQLNGNEAGDFLLKKFADLLKNIFYDNDIIARIGGDEFAVFIKYNSLSELYGIIKKTISKIKNTEFFQNQLSVNIGIALYPQDTDSISDLLEKASIALSIAKNTGDFEYDFYNHEIHNQLIKYSDIKQLLSNAIKNKLFVYHYQPYVDAKTLQIKGAETLIRIYKDNKIIYPNDFIDYAENSGYIKEIEKIMFPVFLENLKKAKIPMSFNISGNSLKDKQHINYLFENIKENSIVIELTEREIATDIEYTKEIFNYFASKNLKISIDDFGTGYSSLVYLKDLPADYLKLDMSFIKNIVHSEKDLAIVETIISFAHKFNIKTIAEGVETKEQVEILQNIDCDYLQGYYFSKPVPFEELMEFIQNNKKYS